MVNPNHSEIGVVCDVDAVQVTVSGVIVAVISTGAFFQFPHSDFLNWRSEMPSTSAGVIPIFTLAALDALITSLRCILRSNTPAGRIRRRSQSTCRISIFVPATFRPSAFRSWADNSVVVMRSCRFAFGSADGLRRKRHAEHALQNQSPRLNRGRVGRW